MEERNQSNSDEIIDYKKRLQSIQSQQDELIQKKNAKLLLGNGIYERYLHPVITADHIPLNWRYDLNPASNPYLMERLGVNATFNAGAIYKNGKYLLAVRVEGADRKSYFAIAESPNGIDNFRFWDHPMIVPETDKPDTNIYDVRLTEHEDGWIYGLFCTERKDPAAPPGDTSMAEAQCGIIRSKNLIEWKRLPDLITYSGQQRNVVLHPEFVEGKYALYTRPQDGFISVGSGGGIGWGTTDSMENAEIKAEVIVDNKIYHTVKELKNGQGPPPLKTDDGWLHLAHGVRNTAAGLRYVLYMFMTALDDPSKIIFNPGGYFMAPEGQERVGDVSNVVFSNGWIVNDRDEVFIYYASSDSRMHVATTSLNRLVDYVKNTPTDGLRSATSVQTIHELIEKNNQFLSRK